MPEISQEELDALKATATEAEALKSRLAGHEEVKADMAKYKKEAQELKAKQEAAEKKSLEESSQFKELYQKEQEAKAAALEEKEKALLSVDRFIKRGSLETAALAAGLKKEALPDLSIIGLDTLEVKKDGDAIKVNGVDALLADLKKSRPHWFGTGKAPHFNDPKGGGAGGGTEEYTANDLIKMEREDPAKYRAVMKARMEAAKASKK